MLALIAAWTDWRSRRIPNWLTVSGLVVGVVMSTLLAGWLGLKTSLEGAGLGLALLLPFVLLRSLGAGDWKFAIALGSFSGPSLLVDLLIWSIFMAGAMALVLVIYKKRFLETMRNIGHILMSLIRFRMPGYHVTLDDPNALKIPKGVALSLSVVLYAILHTDGVL